MKISIAVAIILMMIFIIIFSWQWLFQEKPFGKAVNEVCCAYNDGSFNYLPGNQCNGKIVDNEQCYSYLQKLKRQNSTTNAQ